MTLKWRRVAKCEKWAGYDSGKHVASFVRRDDGTWKAWVDGGRGFQEFLNGSASTMKEWKLSCEVALVELRRRIAQGFEV